MARFGSEFKAVKRGEMPVKRKIGGSIEPPILV